MATPQMLTTNLMVIRLHLVSKMRLDTQQYGHFYLILNQAELE